MSDLQTSLVQFAFYGAYFCFSLPAALFIRRYSYKSGILLGLLLYASGTMLFYPAGEAASYGFFLFAIYVMAGGCAILETTANPYILSMGPETTATRRLNIAQMFNPIGAVAGILISRHFILSELHVADASERATMSPEILRSLQKMELDAVSGTYMTIGVILIIILVVIACVKMPRDKDIQSDSRLRTTFLQLMKNHRWKYGVVAQFFYVGVQTGVWSFTIRLTMHEMKVLEHEASMVFLYSIIAFTLCRMLFTWLMGFVRPIVLLIGASIGAIICTAMVIFSHGLAAIITLVGISACMSLMFPTIYGIALEGISGDRAKVGASGLIMAILGGAIITPVQALLSDRFGISISFIVPMFCFAIVLGYGLWVLYNSSLTENG